MQLAARLCSVDTILVGSVSAITRRRLATVGTDALLPQAAKILSTTPVSLVIVCDAEGRMAGVISKTDIVRSVASTAKRPARLHRPT